MSEQKLRDYLNRVTSELRRTREELHRRQQEATEPIAVVGMACRFPGGVTDPQQLWDLVSTGGDAISPFPTDRGWDLERLHATSSTTASGFLRDIDRFDAEFFGISPREAMAMDPQQRLLLETAWHALEDGGIPPASLRGGATGTFMGTCGQDYPHLLEGTAEDVTGYVSIGSHASVLSGRIAYTLGLQGPALTIDTACSASLVATHTAVRSLRSGECPLALAGGVIIMTTPRSFTEFTKQGGLSGDGRCRSFSDDADGTAWSEGVAVLVLERLSDAVRNGHRVHAVIRGSAINQDGASNGLTAPNGAAQQEVIWRALADARLTPADIDVVEAHGTGTKLGDPIEAGALLATYGGERERPLWLGSMKSNIGHSQAAAGAGALIKMAFAMRHGVLPASLHVGTPSTHVDWSAGDIRLLTENTPWPETGRPRRVAISSFGVSGTNAHLILEEPPTGAETPAEPPARAETPLLLNARTPAALARQAASLATHLDTHPGISLADVAHTLAEGRNAFEHRAVVLAADHTGAAAALRALADGEEHPDVVPGAAVGESQPVFLFPGQGSQWAGMAVELLDSSPEFAKSIAACEAAFAPHVDFSLTEVLRAGEFGRVDVVQPVLFAVMVSLAALWRAHGVVPAAVVGHSQGEIAAAYVAGALSLEDAARVVCLRSKLIREVLGGRGGMASVSAPLPEVLELCGPELSVAAVNGPESVVVSGPAEAIEDLVATATVRVRRIDVDYASHSADVESLREPLLAQLREVAPRPVEVPMLSTLTGAFLTGTELDADYWYRNLREPVQLEQATRTLLAAGHRVFVEASPHPVLTTGLYETAEAAGTPAHAVPSLRREDGGLARFARSLAVAHVLGVPVGWDLSGALTGLPGYAFEPTRFWPRPGTAAGRVTDAGLADPEHPLLAGSAELPGVDGFLFTGVLSTRTQPWLADHAVGGEVLLPGTGLLELAGRAADEAGCGQVEELVLEQPLVLPATGSVTTSVHLGEADEHGRRALTIHSRTDGPWRRNATGTVAPAPAEAPAAAHWPPAGAREQDVSGLYAELAATGFAYGPAFQGLRRVWTEGEEVYAEVALPEPVAADATGYRLHPALLDAALHAARFGGFAAALPFSFSGARLHARAAAALLVRLRRTGPDSLALTAVDPAGQPVLEVDSLTLRAPRRSAPAGAEGALHRLHWLPVESTATGPVWTRVPAATLPELRPGTGQVVAIDLTRPAGAVPAANRELVAGTADLLRAWLAGDQPEDVPLVLLTRGGVAVDPGEDADPVLAAVRGLVRSAQTENPGRFVLLDTDVAEVPGELAARVPASGEPELALREGVLLAPRLGAPTGLQRPPGEVPWRLETTGKGDLSHLALVPAPEAAAPLGPREVRLAVRASGINFRDVFDALGMNRREATPLGAEAAGVVTEIGAEVTGVRVGQRVFGMVPSSFGPRAVTDERMLAPLPGDWTFEQGAAIPVAYLTAWYGLRDLAGLAAGESVLVHAGTGGVGVAAIQLARHWGAEVYATASPAKQSVLRELGVPAARIGNTRTLDFEPELLAASGGRGVDVVLNSLAGEFVDASLRLLPRGGRFLEMGKTDIRQDVPEGIRYRAFDLGELGPDEVAVRLAELLALFTSGALTPPPVRTWDVRRAQEAFRFMSRARHVGKVVLTMPRELDPDGTVLITGGTGGLGGLLAEHLVTRRGVRHLLLTSRSGPAAAGATELAERLRGHGAQVRVEACDTADRDALAALLASVPPAHPLTAVVHTAGVLDDAVLASQDAERIGKVLRPKADGAWHLHELTQSADLAEFVLFSSAAAVLGNAGQANYVAANAFLDGLAQHRAHLGLPATSVGWGLWSAASSMTGELGERELARLARTGLPALTAEQGLAVADALAEVPEPVLAALRVDTAALAERPDLPPVLSGLVRVVRRRTAADAPADLAQRLATMPHQRRVAELVELIRALTAAVLGHRGAAAVDPDRPFVNLGLDSLTAVELRNRIAAATALRLPPTVVFSHPTPAALAEHLAGEVGPAEQPQAATAEPDPVTRLLAELEAALTAGQRDEGTKADLARRLTALAATQAAGPDEDDLSAATDDEVFSMLSEEFGIS